MYHIMKKRVFYGNQILLYWWRRVDREDWIERTVHQFGSEVEQGCIGCGWYNFETWRQRPDICIN